MRYRFPAIAVAASLLATSALAAPVFMLQFGSFESKDEAASHLVAIKSKNAAALGSLTTSVREITLPPDNLTVYRTQAGPLNTRADAQAVCAKLAGSGDDCYVVETAMVEQNVPIGTAKPAVDTAAAAPLEPVTQTNPAAVQIARDPANEAAIASSTTMPAPGFSDMPPQELPAAAPMPWKNEKPMDMALAEAAGEQPMVVAAAPAAPVAAKLPTREVKEKSRSFWWHLNPFSDDEEKKKVAVKPAATPTSVKEASVPVETVAARPNPFTVDPTARPGWRPLETGQVPVVASAPAVPALVPSAPAVAMSQPPIVDNGPFQLPPPPAPLRAQDRAALAAGQPMVAPAVPKVEATPIAPPMKTGDLPVVAAAPSVAPFKSSPSVPEGGAEKIAAGEGNVRVGEAQRVPLTEDVVPPSVSQPVAAVPVVQQPPVSLSPSSTLGQKTLWAQIGQFVDAQAALGYWEAYRQAHPDFPVVRVRVTSPYQAQLRGHTAVSLRIGPFARAESIRNLCTTIPAEKLRCGSITDLGVAANPYGQREGFLPGSRYQR